MRRRSQNRPVTRKTSSKNYVLYWNLTLPPIYQRHWYCIGLLSSALFRKKYSCEGWQRPAHKCSLDTSITLCDMITYLGWVRLNATVALVPLDGNVVVSFAYFEWKTISTPCVRTTFQNFSLHSVWIRLFRLKGARKKPSNFKFSIFEWELFVLGDCPSHDWGFFSHPLFGLRCWWKKRNSGFAPM